MSLTSHLRLPGLSSICRQCESRGPAQPLTSTSTSAAPCFLSVRQAETPPFLSLPPSCSLPLPLGLQVTGLPLPLCSSSLCREGIPQPWGQGDGWSQCFLSHLGSSRPLASASPSKRSHPPWWTMTPRSAGAGALPFHLHTAPAQGTQQAEPWSLRHHCRPLITGEHRSPPPHPHLPGLHTPSQGPHYPGLHTPSAFCPGRQSYHPRGLGSECRQLLSRMLLTDAVQFST